VRADRNHQAKDAWTQDEKLSYRRLDELNELGYLSWMSWDI
jgi:hypothetical protein